MLLYLLSCCMFFSCAEVETSKDYLRFVDPMIGTGAHFSQMNADFHQDVTRKLPPVATNNFGPIGGYDLLHDPGQCLPAVLAPYGMNFWTPQTEDTEQKGIAPYYYGDTEFMGFRASHWIVGGATQDYGSMTIMPMMGELRCSPLKRACKFSHADETSSPAYYSINLKEYSIKAEMTATSRTGIMRFKFEKDGDGYIVLNANSDESLGCVSYDSLKNEVSVLNPVHRIYQGKGQYANFDGHFVVQFSRRPSSYGTYMGDSITKAGKSVEKVRDGGMYLGFKVKAGEEILIKASCSFVSFDGARANMRAENPGWDFDAVRSDLENVWNTHLGRIEVEGDDEQQIKSFYTAFYHASFLPHEVSDADGNHPAFSTGKIVKGRTAYYDDFSMWDTYRALHPLLCIIDPKREADMISSLIEKYEQGGWLPIFPCWNNYTSEMIGDHCCSLVADAFFKGIRSYDVGKAYKALRKNAFELPDTYEKYKEGMGRRALESYTKHGYIPLEDSVKEAYHQAEQVSRTLEYAYDDYCLARLAEALGHKSDADVLDARSMNYKNLFNARQGYMDARHEDGSFENGNPFSFAKYITEGQPCHYTWYVPHDVEGLKELMGGDSIYVSRLDSMFTEKRYWHGNEPCHQVAYMFDYSSAPWKTQHWVREILKSEYGLGADGLAGNDDAGQMSAWYMFSAMGFYPVCPGKPEYAISSPVFKKVTIHQDNGRDFIIEAPSTSDKNRYIKSCKINGHEFRENFIMHDDILMGARYTFEMCPSPEGEKVNVPAQEKKNGNKQK